MDGSCPPHTASRLLPRGRQLIALRPPPEQAGDACCQEGQLPVPPPRGWGVTYRGTASSSTAAVLLTTSGEHRLDVGGNYLSSCPQQQHLPPEAADAPSSSSCPQWITVTGGGRAVKGGPAAAGDAAASLWQVSHEAICSVSLHEHPTVKLGMH